MTIPHRLAGRYARALLDVAVREADPRAIEQQLEAFAGLFRSHPLLDRVLTNPAVPVQRKKAVVNELTARLGLAPVLTKLLAMIAERDALAMLPDLLERYRHRLMDHLGIVRAEVTTAVPVPPERVEAIRQGLAAVSGKDVTMTTRVDPAIIGGVVAKVGSTVYDGSITRQLERIHERMAAGELVEA